MSVGHEQSAWQSVSASPQSGLELDAQNARIAWPMWLASPPLVREESSLSTFSTKQPPLST